MQSTEGCWYLPLSFLSTLTNKEPFKVQIVVDLIIRVSVWVPFSKSVFRNRCATKFCKKLYIRTL
jgi:hypothetical protein